MASGRLAYLAFGAISSSADDIPFWGCGLLGQLRGIDTDGTYTVDGTKQMIDGLKAANPYGKVAYWDWNLAPMTPLGGDPENLTSDFIFMPENWGVTPPKAEWVREANVVGFTDSNGHWCTAQMADIFLGANEPDITGSCMGDMMGKCTAPCNSHEVAIGDCPVAHLFGVQGSASPNSAGHCDCWSDSHATGVGYWPVPGVDNQQPLPTCWDNPQCVDAQISLWKETAAMAVAKGYKYLTTPLVAVSLDYVDSFLTHACAECQDISCGCPTHIGWHYYGNDCLAEGPSGYDDFQNKLDATVALMEKWPFLLGAIVNEVGMLNCGMATPDAICIPNGPDQQYPALDQPNHMCPDTEYLPNGLASFVTELMRRVSLAKTSDGRRAVTSFTWFNQNMDGGTYNLQLFNDDGTVNSLGDAYIAACQSWYTGGPMPAPVPSPPPAPVPPPAPPTPTPTPPAPTPTPPPPSPSPSPSGGSCSVGAAVKCPGTHTYCGGDQCCPDGSTCPSADNSFQLCPHKKEVDCTTASSDLLLV